MHENFQDFKEIGFRKPKHKGMIRLKNGIRIIDKQTNQVIEEADVANNIQASTLQPFSNKVLKEIFNIFI